MDNDPIEVYVPHAGTVRISGSTQPKRAGKCARHFVERGLVPDFLCIGANANQQATKSAGVFRYMMEHYENTKVAFVPMRFLIEIVDPKTAKVEHKDCTVWRTVFIRD